MLSHLLHAKIGASCVLKVSTVQHLDHEHLSRVSGTYIYFRNNITTQILFWSASVQCMIQPAEHNIQSNLIKCT